MPKLIKIKGDASFRSFFRKKVNGKSSIVVYAKKEKFKNLAVYVVINNILNHNKINAPKLLSNHYKDDMIEISDLGEKSFYAHIISKKNKLNSYKSLIKLFNFISFGNKNAELFDDSMLSIKTVFKVKTSVFKLFLPFLYSFLHFSHKDSVLGQHSTLPFTYTSE